MNNTQFTRYVKAILKDLKVSFADPCDASYIGDCLCGAAAVDFSALTALQVTQLMGALDFTQLTVQQIADLQAALGAANLADAVVNSVTNAGVTFNGTGTKVATFNGNIDVTGLIDPTGLQFSGPQPDASMPINTIYVSDGTTSGFPSGTIVFKTATSTFKTLEISSASETPIVDTANNFTATTVEGALAELATSTSAKYVQTFVVGDWVAAGLDRTLSIAQTTHLKGVTPIIRVEENIAGTFVNTGVLEEVSAAGDIILRITNNGAGFNGRVIIL
jgi:hypothetical protein